jgi:hypothetical protein
MSDALAGEIAKLREELGPIAEGRARRAVRRILIGQAVVAVLVTGGLLDTRVSVRRNSDTLAVVLTRQNRVLALSRDNQHRYELLAARLQVIEILLGGNPLRKR